MREIKFRAWRGDAPKKEREMIYFNLYNAEEFLNPFWDTAIMQYTGLKDKNGKETYEGDIVEWRADELERDLVIFEDGCFMCFGEPLNKFKLSIIGNIYENPELLQSEK